MKKTPLERLKERNVALPSRGYDKLLRFTWIHIAATLIAPQACAFISTNSLYPKSQLLHIIKPAEQTATRVFYASNRKRYTYPQDIHLQ